MARQRPDEVARELDQQEDEMYGDSLSSAPDPDKVAKDTESDLADVIGNDPDISDGFSIADEIDEDEGHRGDTSLGDNEEEEEEIEEDLEDPSLGAFDISAIPDEEE